MEKQIDMLLVNLPWADLQTPYCAPALLKAIGETHGYNIKTKDYNIDLKKEFCKNDQKFFEELQDYFISFVNNDNFQYQDTIEKFYDFIIDDIEKTKPKYFGISVFSLYTQKSTFELCNKIKNKSPGTVIVLGGRGLNVRPYMSVTSYLNEKEKIINFSEVMQSRGLADHLIIGDGEDALIDLLSGKMSEIDFTWHTAKSKTLEYPYSNFDDYRLNDYVGVAGTPQLHVISSKGCVRKCDFCDVGVQFKRFLNKDGSKMAEEIIYLAEKYNIRDFATADSILNGNMIALKQTVEKLAEYNDDKSDEEKIKWGGNWICRPPGRISPSFFQMMKRSGCQHLTIGAEHGSNDVLLAMDKKTNVEGLFYEITEMEKVGIQCALNNIIGHWAEYFKDFEKFIDMIITLGPRFANETITQFMLGTGFAVLKGTPAAMNFEKNGIVTTEDNFSFVWYTKKNPNLTIKTRMARIYFLYHMCFYLNIPVSSPYSFLLHIKNRLSESYDNSLKFYEKHFDKTLYKECPSVNLLDQYQNYVDQKIQDMYSKSKIKIEVDSFHSNGAPNLFVKHNDITLYDNLLQEGANTVELEIKNVKSSCITIGMSNKKKNDTIIDNHGNIVKDKKIMIKKITIDSIDLTRNQHYFYNKLKYYEDGKICKVSKPGFYLNSYLEINFEKIFWQDYLKNHIAGLHWQAGNDKENSKKLLSTIKDISMKYQY